MFKDYRKIMDNMGGTLNEYVHKSSQTILDSCFENTTNYKKVFVEGKEYEARIITDSRTTIRSGNGNYVIHFKGNLKFKAGTYVDIPQYDELIRWMIIYEDDDPIFDKPIIKKCNYKLKWKNEYGEIIERDSVFADNIRLTANTQDIQRGEGTLPNNYKIILLPYDIETINIKRGTRFLIDATKNLRHYPNSYITVNRNVISKMNNFDDENGVIEISITQDQFNPKLDNLELMIADYYTENQKKPELPFTPPISPKPNPEQLKTAQIKHKGSNNLIMGMQYKEYSAEFYDNGILNDTIIPQWEVVIVEENKQYYDYKIENNKLLIKCEYSPLLIKSYIKIKLKDESGEYIAEESVKVVSMI